MLDSIRYSASKLRLRFADGEMHIDSTRIHTDAATVDLSGGIGLPKSEPRDSITFSVGVDSLGGLRPYLSHPDTTLLGAAKTLPDSMSGTGDDRGVTSPERWTRSTSTGTLQGNNLYLKRDQGEALKATFDLARRARELLRFGRGRDVDSVTYAGIALDTIGGRLTIDDSSHRRFVAGALSHTGPTASASGDWSTSGDTNFVRRRRVRADDRRCARGDSPRPRTSCSTPSARASTRCCFAIADSGVVIARGNVPAAGPATAELRALHIPLRDIGEFAQVSDTIAGMGDLTASVTGTRAKPRVTANADLTGVRWYGVDVERRQAERAGRQLARRLRAST